MTFRRKPGNYWPIIPLHAHPPARTTRPTYPYPLLGFARIIRLL